MCRFLPTLRRLYSQIGWWDCVSKQHPQSRWTFRLLIGLGSTEYHSASYVSLVTDSWVPCFSHIWGVWSPHLLLLWEFSVGWPCCPTFMAKAFRFTLGDPGFQTTAEWAVGPSRLVTERYWSFILASLWQWGHLFVSSKHWFRERGREKDMQSWGRE